MIESEINEIGEELSFNGFESDMLNNVIRKPEEFGKSSRRNTKFIGPMYMCSSRTIKQLSLWVHPKKTMSFEETTLTPISQTSYILNICGGA